jgi:hypothetical protein
MSATLPIAPAFAPEPRDPKEFKSELKPIWCPGCGDFGVLQALYRALAAIGRPPHEIAFISGIGCSSRIPGYTTAYGFNTVHGRALPIARASSSPIRSCSSSARAAMATASRSAAATCPTPSAATSTSRTS